MPDIGLCIKVYFYRKKFPFRFDSLYIIDEEVNTEERHSAFISQSVEYIRTYVHI